MKPGLWDYVKAAFNARPLGMPIPPNWIGLAAFGLLGLLNPGFWALGAGLELAYLSLLAHNPRLRRQVQARQAGSQDAGWQQRLAACLGELNSQDRERYRRLGERCQGILQRPGTPAEGLPLQAEALSRLLWVYLRLLNTRNNIRQLLREAESTGNDQLNLQGRREELESRLKSASSADLRRSIESQMEILKQRSENQAEARRKLGFLDSELERIEQQVELLREEALLATDAATLSTRIDSISSTLTDTARWVTEQEQYFGGMEELTEEAPPLLTQRLGQ